MKSLIRSTIKHKTLVLIFFIVLSVLSVFAMLQVQVNYNLQDYLPNNVPSSKALTVLENEFSMTIPNARVMAPVESIQDAVQHKVRLEEVSGVDQVMWLDDSLDIRKPLEFLDKGTVEGFYKGGYAIYQVTADTTNASKVLTDIYSLHEKMQVDGQLVDLANAQRSTQKEIFSISIIMVPLILIILLWATNAWLEPLAFLAAIGVAIVLNMGTNLMLGKISFITQAVAAVLQLAVSMDYAIFLLNRFNSNRKEGHDPETAMILAMQKAVTAILSSAMTTVFGFLALIFMRFRIGGDLGIVMAKSILFSFLSVMFFMPCFLLLIYKWIDKTQHRSFIPNFHFVGKIVVRFRVLIIILAIVIAIPAFLASRKNEFIYGMGGYPEESKAELDRKDIQDRFGIMQQMSLLVPKGEINRQLALEEEIKKEKEVLSLISYNQMVDPAIPKEVIDSSQLKMLLSKNYMQIIITAALQSEGEKSFEFVETIRSIADQHYPDNYHLTGQNVIMSDMKDTIQKDNTVVNGLAILAIAIVILLAFRSISIPVLLVLTIEIAIWLNLSVPYFTGSSLSYIGYLIISTVQLGATVDYAIIYTEHYLDSRKLRSVNDSILLASKETIPSLLPPALILTTAGFALMWSSSLGIVSELGEVLGRGAILSLLMVLFLLPALLAVFDTIIRKTSLQLQFAPAKKNIEGENLYESEVIEDDGDSEVDNFDEEEIEELDG